MAKCGALYTRSLTPRFARATVELARDTLHVARPDGDTHEVLLNGAAFHVRDAACAQRFVRHLSLHHQQGRAHLVTPPDEGAIAPRAARLPVVPDEYLVVDASAWDAVVDWLRGGGRLGGRTVRQLAALARIASPGFAIAIGEWAAQVAAEMIWDRRGPMRGGGDLRQTLRPLEEAAAESPSAAEAWVAALSCASAMG